MNPEVPTLNLTPAAGHRRSPYHILLALPLVLGGSSLSRSRLFALTSTFIPMLLAIPMVTRAHEGYAVAFFAVLPLFGWFTAGLERALAPSMGYLKALPVSGSPKATILALPCGAVVVLTAIGGVVCRLSAAEVMSLIGLGLWAVAIGHWFAARRTWLLIVGVVLACWAPIALIAAAVSPLSDPVGDRIAAVLSLAVAAAGLVFSPRDQTSRVLYGPSHGRTLGAFPAVRAGRPWGSTVIQRPGRTGVVRNAWRVWNTATPAWGRVALVGAVILFAPAGVISFPAFSPAWISAIMPLATFMSRTNAPTTLGFLRTRPFGFWSIVGGTIVPWAAAALFMPLLNILLIQPMFYIGPKALGLLSTGAMTERLRYLREVVGATFLPMHLPAAGIPPAMWLPLRGLLYRHVVKLCFLSLAVLFSVAGRQVDPSGGGEHRRRWPGRLLMAASLLATVPCWPTIFPGRHVPWPAPPLWLAAILAISAVAPVAARNWQPLGHRGVSK